ncbi:host attachment family protein [Tianweitania sediminis]|jgi:protein required for attachment to host cells|uniref:Host attachment protein n=1 Tax=Tianweitania sediminis TaxID=1502156 RepID=A0A8J7QYQ6_9HYPH|nr:host attachment family protein [Tianweitania sediminis]MBP0437702.1 host attachment protein [Tianweitania sediminis]HEV7416633.1 host attachment family protein [Tianweitania sediminis]
MSETVSIPEKTLVVVADGHQAILLRSHGVKDALTLTEERRVTPKNLDDEGPSGSRPVDQTPRQTDEATFAKQLANALYSMKQEHKFQHMVLAADPQTLGQLRDTMHKTVSESVILTLNKELTNHSANELAAAVRDAAG